MNQAFFLINGLKSVSHADVAKTKAAETLGVHVRKEIIQEIISRGDALDKTKSNYAALVLEKWFSDGCPPVSEADRLMQIAKLAEKKPAKKTP